MELARGSIADRPWGVTLGAVAARSLTGEVIVRSSAGVFRMLFAAGTLVDAMAPGTRSYAALQAAARTFAVEHGEFVVTQTAVEHACAIAIGQVIYLGARVFMCPRRLAADLRYYGDRFALTDDADPVAGALGLTAGEQAVLTVLRAGGSLHQLEAAHVDPRTAHAVTYALLAVRACVPITAAPTARTTPRLARGTLPADRNALARDAFGRGQRALDGGALDLAVTELARAVDLAPADFHYGAMLAWARFCAADDKAAVAEATRQTLHRAILRSSAPEAAQFFLGRVERMLGREREALRHFTAVLDAQPDHPDAASEVRVLQARLAR